MPAFHNSFSACAVYRPAGILSATVWSLACLTLIRSWFSPIYSHSCADILLDILVVTTSTRTLINTRMNSVRALLALEGGSAYALSPPLSLSLSLSLSPPLSLSLSLSLSLVFVSVSVFVFASVSVSVSVSVRVCLCLCLCLCLWPFRQRTLSTRTRTQHTCQSRIIALARKTYVPSVPFRTDEHGLGTRIRTVTRARPNHTSTYTRTIFPILRSDLP